MLSERFSRSLKAMALLTVLASQADAGVNQWTKIGPEGGEVRQLVMDPSDGSNVYALLTYGGLFKSQDGGRHWFEAQAGLEGHVKEVAIAPSAPSTLYAATILSIGREGIFKTTNGGKDWSAVHELPVRIHSLAVDPRDSATVYTGSGSTLFKSTDEGVHWIAFDIATDENSYVADTISALVIDPQAPSTVYAGVRTGFPLVRKSTDGGAHWAPADAGLPRSQLWALKIDSDNPSVLYAATSHGLFKSTDAGQRWHTTGMVRSLLGGVVEVSPSALYVGTYDGIFKSMDGGTTWNLMNQELLNTSVTCLAFVPQVPSTLYVGTRGRLYKSEDSGESWRPSSTGLQFSKVKVVAVDPSNRSTLYAGTLDGIFKSTNRGAHWVSINEGLKHAEITALVVDPSMPSRLYAGTLGGVVRSTDGGGHWEYVTQKFAADVALSQGILYAGENGGVFKSTDGGDSWLATGFSSSVKSLAVHPMDPSILYAGLQGGLFKSVDGGVHWSNVGGSIAINNDVVSVAFDPRDPAVVYVGLREDNIVYKSADGGVHWTRLETYLGEIQQIVFSLVVDPLSSTVYVGTAGNVLRSTDSGMTWKEAAPGLPKLVPVHGLVVDPSVPTTLYATTPSAGVLELTQTPAVSATLEARGDLRIGGTLYYTLTLHNDGLADQGDNPGDELVDVLPPELTLAGATVLSGGGTLVSDPGTNTLTWNGSIPAGGTVVIEIEALIVSGPRIVHQARVAFDADNDGVNEATTLTDDPALSGVSDPTAISLAVAVPTLDSVGLAFFVLLLGGGALTVLRRRPFGSR